MKKIVNKADIKALLGIDHVFSSIDADYGHPPDWSRPQGFISLSKIILEQQLSLASANAHFIKLSKYLGEFTPSNILRLTDEEMRSCHISRQKSKYLRELSAAILEGNFDLEELKDLIEEEARRQLTSIKGIGNWTADIYLMFCLQSKDIFPIGDIALVKAAKELWHADTKAELAKLSESWKPYRSLAAYYLWHYYLSKKNRAVKPD
ncbi:MAG TPA: hypothetical protein VK155_09835 [Bacteroidales bacterium]|nr:hypothetical protein [Bacteroidales bacterium]